MTTLHWLVVLRCNSPTLILLIWIIRKEHGFHNDQLDLFIQYGVATGVRDNRNIFTDDE